MLDNMVIKNNNIDIKSKITIEIIRKFTYKCKE